MSRTFQLRRSKTVTVGLLRKRPLPIPEAGSKDARGSVLVIAGSPQLIGPVILAAESALRAGAGKLQIATAPEVALHVGAAVPEALVVPFERAPDLAASADAVVFGPGMGGGKDCAQLLALVLARVRAPLVLDAAALNCLIEDADLLKTLPRGGVVTPHAGEMASMLGCERAAVESDPPQYAVRAAQRFAVVVALKGEHTYICGPDGALYCNIGGHVGLATSGSGDALAGIIGGLCARGLHPLDAALWGVYAHAAAGELLARRTGIGFLAREIPAQLPPVFRKLGRGK